MLPEEAQFEAFTAAGYKLQLQLQKESLAKFRTHFDVWFSEKTLHESGEVDAVADRLADQGHVYDMDGAVWLRTTDFGDDKDRVIVRSNGEKTYFAADCAYYLDKRDRGFSPCIYMLGADHHGYVGRLKALAACAGDDPERDIEVLIGQLVNMVSDGEQVKISKRAGTMITLEDLVDVIGVDAARYPLARSSTDQNLVLDVDLLTSAKNENPVCYVQYAHSRMCAVKRNAAERGLTRAWSRTSSPSCWSTSGRPTCSRRSPSSPGSSRWPPSSARSTRSPATWRTWPRRTTASTPTAGSCRRARTSPPT